MVLAVDGGAALVRFDRQPDLDARPQRTDRHASGTREKIHSDHWLGATLHEKESSIIARRCGADLEGHPGIPASRHPGTGSPLKRGTLRRSGIRVSRRMHSGSPGEHAPGSMLTAIEPCKPAGGLTMIVRGRSRGI